MAFNSKIEPTKSIIEQTGAQSVLLKSQIPIRDEIMPILDITKFSYDAYSNSATNATSATILLTSSDKDFYVTAAFVSVIKDVTSTSLYSAITCTVAGGTKRLISIAGLSLTVQADSLSISFPYPIKVDRGTGIYVVNSTNVGNVTANGGITGFYL